MRTGRFTLRRNTHQAFDIKAIRFADIDEEVVGIGRRHSSLLRFFTRIDLHVKPRHPAQVRARLGYSSGQLLSVQRLYDVE